MTALFPVKSNFAGIFDLRPGLRCVINVDIVFDREAIICKHSCVVEVFILNMCRARSRLGLDQEYDILIITNSNDINNSNEA